jgi:hypothetical protein
MYRMYFAACEIPLICWISYKMALLKFIVFGIWQDLDRDTVGYECILMSILEK